MTLAEILEATAALDDQITQANPGDPELAAAITHIGDLEGELAHVRELQGPLVPDAESPPSLEEKSAAELADALRDLKRAASAKR